MTDTIQNQPKTRRDAIEIEMDNVRSQKANLKKNTDANQLLSLRKRLDVLLRTGQLLLESSADTNRIRRNMVRAALFLGFNEDNLHIFIDHNILMVNYSDEAHSFTKFQKRVKDGINFTTIEAISHLTYKAVRKHFSVEDYEAELEKIAARPRNYSQLVTSAGAALACGGFCIQFGCDWIAFLYASLAAFIGFNCRAYFNKLGVNKYFSIAIAAFVSTLIAWITTYLPAWTTTPLHPLLACALFIVPGVPLINFVDDMLDTNFRVGMERAINTVMMMVGMAFGIVLALKVCSWTFHFAPDIMSIPMVPEHPYWMYATAAAISAMGFSMIFNIPKRLLPVVAIGGIIAVCTRNLVSLQPDMYCSFSLGQGGIIGSLAGSALVSIICIKAVHVFHTPHQVIAISSVIPMVPGVLMYRCLFSLFTIPGTGGEQMSNFVTAGVNGLNASLMIGAIALGVAVPNIIARRRVNASKRRAFEAQIKEQRERGGFIDITKL